MRKLYLLAVLAKNERANFSKAERNELAGLVDILVWHGWRNNHERISK